MGWLTNTRTRRSEKRKGQAFLACFVEADEPEAVRDAIVRLVRERIPERFGLDPRTEIQVLAPMNRAVLGARNLNQVLQQALNPDTGQPQIERFGWTFRQGDRVIQTENRMQASGGKVGCQWLRVSVPAA